MYMFNTKVIKNNCQHKIVNKVKMFHKFVNDTNYDNKISKVIIIKKPHIQEIAPISI